jgi:hypothetical protein
VLSLAITASSKSAGSPAANAAHLVASYAAPPANTAMAAALQLLQAYFSYVWPSAAFLLSSRLWSGAAGQYGLGSYFFPVVVLLQAWPSAAFCLSSRLLGGTAGHCGHGGRFTFLEPLLSRSAASSAAVFALQLPACCQLLLLWIQSLGRVL